MDNVALLHEQAMLIHFSSVLRADNSEKFCVSHSSLGISWLFVESLMCWTRWSPATWILPFLRWLLFALGFPSIFRQQWVCFFHARLRSPVDAQTDCSAHAQLSENWISLRFHWIHHCAGLSDTCWNLWLMEKILNAFQTWSVGRKKAQMLRNMTVPL